MSFSRRVTVLVAALVATHLSVAAQALFPPLTLDWSVQAPPPAEGQAAGGFYATPVLIGDTAYAVHTRQGVGAFALADSKVRWGQGLAGQAYPGLAAEGNLAVAVSGTGDIYGLDRATGTERWQAQLPGTIYASPVIDDGVVIVGTGDTGLVAAFNGADGRKLWQQQLGDRLGSALAVAGGTVYAPCYDHQLYALDLRTGMPLWRYQADTVLDSRPLAVADRVYVKQTDDVLVALRAADGERLWATQPRRQVADNAPSTWSTLALANGRLLTAGYDGALLAVSAVNGNLLWETAPRHFSSAPAIAGDLGYVGGKDGALTAVDLTNGEIVWRWSPPAAVQPGQLSGIMWPPVIVGRNLLAASLDGSLYAFTGTTDEAAWTMARAEAAAAAQAAAERQAQFERGWRDLLGPAVEGGLQPTGEELVAVVDLGNRLNGVVVWESNRDGAWDIFRINTDGTGFDRLTNFAATDDPLAYTAYLRPRISPDGQWVLFEYGMAEQPGESWLVPMQPGGQARRVLVGEPLNWLPDSSGFYFVRDSLLQQYTLADGAEVVVHDVPLTITGSGQGLVGAVAPDLSAVAYRSPKENEFFDFAQGKTIHTTVGCEAQIGRDGNLYWVNRPKEFRMWSPQTEQDHVLLAEPSHPTHSYTYFPTVSADGKWLAYGASPDEHSHDSSDYEIFVVPLDNGQAVGDPVRLSWHGKTDRWPDLWVAP